MRPSEILRDAMKRQQKGLWIEESLIKQIEENENKTMCPFAVEGWKNKEGFILVEGRVVCVDFDDYCVRCMDENTIVESIEAEKEEV